MEPDSIGKRLKEFRLKKNLSVRALAKASGVPQSTLSFIESGARYGRGLSLETAKKLCRALGVGLTDLAGSPFEEDDEPTAFARAGHRE